MTTGLKIAILIDGDNADPSLIEQYIGEAGKFGKITVKRIYGDWTNNSMRSWKEQLNSFAVKPMQKFAFTKGKNATDTALIIDAMDLLHYKHVDGFCIVSSDSDYTGLATRIREEGMFIMGIGKSQTPEAFVKACESFTFEEILTPQEIKEVEKKEIEKKEEVKKSIPKKDSEEGPKAPKLRGIKVVGKMDLNLIKPLQKSGIKSIDLGQIERAFQMVVDIDTGLVLLSRFSEALRKVDPTFDHRNFGHSTFRKFCESLAPNYETICHDDNTTISLKKKE